MAAKALVSGAAFPCVDRCFRGHGLLRQDRRLDHGGFSGGPLQVVAGPPAGLLPGALKRPASRPLKTWHEAVPGSRPAFGTRAGFASLAPIKQPPCRRFS